MTIGILEVLEARTLAANGILESPEQ